LHTIEEDINFGQKNIKDHEAETKIRHRGVANLVLPFELIVKLLAPLGLHDNVLVLLIKIE
jgi:hypothetical protein